MRKLGACSSGAVSGSLRNSVSKAASPTAAPVIGPLRPSRVGTATASRRSSACPSGGPSTTAVVSGRPVRAAAIRARNPGELFQRRKVLRLRQGADAVGGRRAAGRKRCPEQQIDAVSFRQNMIDEAGKLLRRDSIGSAEQGAKRPRGILHDADAALDGFGRPFGLDAQVVCKMGDGLLADSKKHRHRNDQADDDDGKRGVPAPAVPSHRCGMPTLG